MSKEDTFEEVLKEVTAKRCLSVLSTLVKARCDPAGKWGYPPEKSGQPMTTIRPTVIAGLLGEIGCRVTVHPVDDARNPGTDLHVPLIQAYLDGKKGSKTLELEAHYDCQTVIPEFWKPRDPYAATVEGDILYGRGVVDSIGQLAAMICAVETIQKSGVKLAGNIIISSGPDGEYGGQGWVKAAKLDPQVDWVIAGEATYSVENDAYEISTAHENPCRFNIDIVGKTSHFGEPHKGINALVELGRVISSFGYYGENVKFTYKPWKYSDEVTKLPRLGPFTSSSSAAGGMPNKASVGGFIEAVPGMTVESIKQDLEKHLAALRKTIPRADKPDYHVSVTSGRGAQEVPEDDPLVVALADATEAIHGKRPTTAVFRLITDGSNAIPKTINPEVRGKPYGVTFGGGNPELAHSDCEYVPINGKGGLVEMTEIYARTAVDLLLST